MLLDMTIYYPNAYDNPGVLMGTIELCGKANEITGGNMWLGQLLIKGGREGGGTNASSWFMVQKPW